MSNQLLPCPFCGGKADIESDDTDYPNHEAVCQDCGARCHVTGCGPEDGWEWNRRATQPAAGEPATVDDLARRLFAAFAKAEPESGITLNPTSYWATFADMARAVLQDAPPAAAHGDEAGRVMELLATCEWKLIKAIPADYLTDESNTKNTWWVERQQAPYCTESGERVWTGATAIEAFEKAIAAMRAQGGEGGE